MVELLVQNGEDGLVQPKAGDDKGGAAADADHRHPEPALVAEQVARGHLPGEGEPPPDRADVLQKHPLARLGGPGAHQAGGGGHQGGQTGPQRRPGGEGHRRQHRAEVQPELGLEFQGGDGVHDVEGVGDDQGYEGAAQGKAENAPRQAGGKGVADVLFGDGQPGEAHGLERADLGALLLHHPGHGGQAGQRRHQEEDHRE